MSSDHSGDVTSVYHPVQWDLPVPIINFEDARLISSPSIGILEQPEPWKNIEGRLQGMSATFDRQNDSSERFNVSTVSER